MVSVGLARSKFGEKRNHFNQKTTTRNFGSLKKSSCNQSGLRQNIKVASEAAGAASVGDGNVQNGHREARAVSGDLRRRRDERTVTTIGDWAVW